jgi:phosphoribosylamine---glycine ligase
MRILVIGAGAREHALCWALSLSPQTTFLACLPGNGGTTTIANNVPLDPMDFSSGISWARDHQIDLIIVGPDDPLGAGIVDAYQEAGFRCFGPSKAAARIESSKVWSKDFMQRHGIPTASASIVTNETMETAIQSLHTNTSFPVAIKADGLAAGKGVIIAREATEAEAALRAMLVDAQFGKAGQRVLIESFLRGREVSIFAICDGQHYRMMGSACDHKRAYDGDTGPNTGGMGAYAPAGWLDAATLATIEDRIIAPTVAGMASDGVPFSGFLFAGLMITADGPYVIEFNARFGDPEAQVILPLLATPLLDLILAAIDGKLDQLPPLIWNPGAACGVVVAAGSYPQSSIKGLPLNIDPVDEDILTFHAGTKLLDNSNLQVSGGRIITVVGRGATLADAREHAYANVDRIHFEGARYRKDIGANV